MPPFALLFRERLSQDPGASDGFSIKQGLLFYHDRLVLPEDNPE